MNTIETERLKIQNQLDSTKKQIERNKLGQFATPTALATDIVEHAKSLLPSSVNLRFLDPAIGTGSFFSGLLRSFPVSQISQAVGYEIDLVYGWEAIKLWQGTPLKVYLADFTKAESPKVDEDRANLLICNPPYVRHHHLSQIEKQRLLQASKQATGIQLTGLAGLYCHFLFISHKWMAENGLAAWLIPSEFMDVNYGQQVKKYLLNNVTLLHIHRFNPENLQFNDALVSSTVVWFKKTLPPVNHVVKFTYGGKLASPDVSRSISTNILRNELKWTKFPSLLNNVIVPVDNAEQPSIVTNAIVEQENITLSDLFEIKRGLATGANKFFLLTQEQITKHQLPTELLTPILPSPRYLVNQEIEADHLGNPVLERKLFLLNCDLLEEEVKNKYPSVWQYLQIGIKSSVDQGFLCSHRKPWYSQEYRTTSMFLCTYMGRQNTGSKKPFRFILNYSKAIATNVYLMLYPKTKLQKVLKDKPELSRLIWQNLNDISTSTLIGEGRVYGDGLHKVEPKELSKVLINNLVAALPELNFCLEPNHTTPSG